MRLPLFAALALIATPALAADPVATPATQVYRLSPADRDAAIAAAALRPETNSPALLPVPIDALPPSAERDAILGKSLYAENEGVRDRRPHGEVGMFVGTGGNRGVFGTVGVPLGDNGFASFSFDTGRYPNYGYQPYRWVNGQRR